MQRMSRPARPASGITGAEASAVWQHYLAGVGGGHGAAAAAASPAATGVPEPDPARANATTSVQTGADPLLGAP